jgi:hypothetical protein
MLYTVGKRGFCIIFFIWMFATSEFWLPKNILLYNFSLFNKYVSFAKYHKLVYQKLQNNQNLNNLWLNTFYYAKRLHSKDYPHSQYELLSSFMPKWRNLINFSCYFKSQKFTVCENLIFGAFSDLFHFVRSVKSHSKQKCLK